jgi:hypothetical protein
VPVLGEHEVAHPQRMRPLEEIDHRPGQRIHALRGQIPRVAEPDDHVGGEDANASRVGRNLDQRQRLHLGEPVGDERGGFDAGECGVQGDLLCYKTKYRGAATRMQDTRLPSVQLTSSCQDLTIERVTGKEPPRRASRP